MLYYWVVLLALRDTEEHHGGIQRQANTFDNTMLFVALRHGPDKGILWKRCAFLLREKLPSKLPSNLPSKLLGNPKLLGKPETTQ